MKLEFDLQIQGLTEEVALPASFPPLPEDNEKVYAMADDATLLVKVEIETLTAVKIILTEFEIISGLGCNVEKTSLMWIGTEAAITGDIIKFRV
jgi:hypothetical protein